MLNRIGLSHSPLSQKVLFIAVLTLGSLIPLGLVMDMTFDRQQLYHQVVAEIGQSWGEQQEIAGPALVLPYTYEMIQESFNEQGKLTKTRHTVDSEFVILPTDLNLDIKLKHDFLSRGIFQSLVYNATLSGSASFDISKINLPNIVNTYPERARLVFGISANQAIDSIDLFKPQLPPSSSGAQQPVEQSNTLMPGTGLGQLSGLDRGFHQAINLPESTKQLSLAFTINLRGSQGLSVLPTGQQTSINLSADWPHPSFSGLLPMAREIDSNGFSATWNVSHLTRNYPQHFSKNSPINLREVNAHTTLFEPVTHYGKIERAVKYGLLFIILTSIMLLIFELSQAQSLSAIQYLLVASAMTLFYLVLLSLSEHISFGYAYLIAASMPLFLVSIYIGSVTRSAKRGGIMAAMLIALYSVLYSILKLEDYALLMGTGLLVVVLGILMYITRHSPEDLLEMKQN
ncbi:cell envelope integrity protein CreD [Shewanella colwelliana]|uniref:cell envelope integrity protein CreD n=1 Tax=Shewanella colwelliana TaxID=23 RepID=UPI0022AF1F0C|nr:cell envelope integrity protein CreD [Shewanella colwelliana]MCZ4338303.1 cell envelope integrity protein CreD [Shewanella colwelliana]